MEECAKQVIQHHPSLSLHANTSDVSLNDAALITCLVCRVVDSLPGRNSLYLTEADQRFT